MKKQLLYLLLICLTLYTCSKKNEDPFRNVKFGIISKKDFINRMIKKKYFSEPNDDSSLFRYHIGDYPVLVGINPDDYDIGNVRSITIYLENYGNRGLEPRRKADIKSIERIYKSWYIEPDSTKYYYKIRNDYVKDSARIPAARMIFPKIEKFQTKEQYDRSKPLGIKNIFWSTRNYDLIYSLSLPEKSNEDSLVELYSDAELTYKMKGYDERLEKIRDSIRQTQTINDIVKISIYSYEWNELYSGNYDSEFIINNIGFNRIDRGENPQKVTDLKFDILIQDKFQSEICKLEGISIDLEDKPLYADMILQTGKSNISISHKYDKNSFLGMQMEEARRYSKHNKLKVKAVLKSIIFDNGTVMKK